MTCIADLADHPHLIPQLVAGFEAEWPAYFGSQPPGTAERDFHNDDQWIVIFEGDQALGVVALREHTEPAFAKLKPALGGLWVAPARRRQGVGASLIKAGMRLAASQSEPMLYTFTNDAAALVLSLGWKKIDTVIHEGEAIGAYAVALSAA